VAAIEELRRQGPTDLVCRSAGEFHDVNFNLEGCLNFNRKIEDDPQPPAGGPAKRRIALINYLWGIYSYQMVPGDGRDQIETLLGEKIDAVLFAENPYELVETRSPPSAARTALRKPAGAFISATPNPVPAGGGFGRSVITWDTGDDTFGEVVQAALGWPEQPMSVGARGQANVTWLTAGNVYEFRLYAGPGKKRLLDAVRVTRKWQ
jgi:hypothetical protein